MIRFRPPGATVWGIVAILTGGLALVFVVTGLYAFTQQAHEMAAGRESPEAPNYWSPTQGTTWQWQLSGDTDFEVDADVWDLDGFETSRATVDELHSQGKKVICYVSVGTWEPYHPDARRFPQAIRGSRLEDWPDERWIDIRQLGVLRPIMDDRIKMCADKGFDGVEPDNVDAHQNVSGFALEPRHQRDFNIMIAGLAHKRGMSVALKNDLSQVRELEPYFDFAMNEQCVEYQECDSLNPFLEAGKAVLHVEYELKRSQFCHRIPDGFSSMEKRWSLDAWRKPCG